MTIFQTEEMPLLALRGLVVFPEMMLHFDVGRNKSIRALDEAMSGDQRIFLVAQKDVSVDDPTETQLYKVGVVARVRQVLRLPNDTLRIMVEGEYRSKIVQYTQTEPYFRAQVRRCAVQHITDNLQETAKNFAQFLKERNFEMSQGHLWLKIPLCSDETALEKL
ncbi:MAG: hypothetical protein E7534_07270, partial [Ruminococcaceae bacterium]|nr:hypothetical protein [Oscillospiraceae bacterium]